MLRVTYHSQLTSVFYKQSENYMNERCIFHNKIKVKIYMIRILIEFLNKHLIQT